MTATLEDYTKATDDLLEYISVRPDIIDIWQYGEISEPGVSDLDLIVVAANNPKAGLSEFLASESLPASTKTAMAHANLILVPADTSEDIFFWDDISCKSILTRTDISCSKDIDYNLRKNSIFIDWFFERCFRILSLEITRESNMTKALGLFKSFLYSAVRYLELSSRTCDQYLSISASLLTARKSWTGLTPAERHVQVSSLSEEFKEFCHSIHRSVFEWFSTESMFAVDGHQLTQPIRMYYPDGHSFNFQSYYSAPSNAGNRVTVPLPSCLLGHFATYSLSGSQLSNRILSGFEDKEILLTSSFYEDELSSYRDFLDLRIGSASCWYDYLRKHSFPFGLFKFGWYLD